MNNQILREKLFTPLGLCLEYPVEDFREIFKTLENPIESVSNRALNNFQKFMTTINKMKFSEWQEYYVKTFDVMPQCNLYLSIYLFGEENYKRAELMTGLKASYEKHRVFEMTELPDHLAVIFKHNTLLGVEEWSELVSMCIIPAIPKIIKLLEKYNNPYAFLLKTIHGLLVKTEKVYA